MKKERWQRVFVSTIQNAQRSFAVLTGKLFFNWKGGGNA
jgi:hypothetical protein